MAHLDRESASRQSRQQPLSPRAQRLLWRLGWLSLAAGLLANEFLLASVLSPDGSIDDPADLAVIRLAQAVLLLWGAMNVLFSRHVLAAKLNLLLVVLILISPLLGEVMLRGGIAANAAGFRNPGLYAESLSEDDYWKLEALWADEVENSGPGATAKKYHERLGWAPISSPQNPLGIVGGPADVSSISTSPILFYGDSFVEGTTDSFETRIPQLLNEMITRTVYNYGVSGYGLGQVSLRVQATAERFDRPVLLIGILTSDLDRSILQIRGAPKPYFTVEEGRLVLQGVPVYPDAQAWVREYPVSIRSYLAAFLRMRFLLHQPGPVRELTLNRERKTELNHHILGQLANWSRERGMPLYFVLFYEPDEFDSVGWRESFLLEQMRQLQLDFVNTKPMLARAAAQRHATVYDFYQADHHLNAEGNRLVAQQLSDYLLPRLAD